MLVYVWLFLLGLCAGWGISKWVDYLTPPVQLTSATSKSPSQVLFRTRIMLATGLLYALLPYAIWVFGCQQTPEVQQSDFWWWGRVVYQLILITLLVAATATDLREYIIHDAVILPGILIAVITAFASGHLQMVHLWVDWSQEIKGLKPAYVPSWIAELQHWHGLAVSIAGIVAGAGVAWLVRLTSSIILRKEALGFGDVTLMAMIGAFLGWQPVMFVFLFAPACALIIGLVAWLSRGKSYIPFGPFLCAATVVVLLSWHWLWRETRLVFGHPQSLLIIAAVAWGALVILLVIFRLIQSKSTNLHHL